MNYEFQRAVCLALGISADCVQECQMTLKPGGLVEVRADIIVMNDKKLETIFREYRFEAVPK